ARRPGSRTPTAARPAWQTTATRPPGGRRRYPKRAVSRAEHPAVYSWDFTGTPGPRRGVPSVLWPRPSWAGTGPLVFPPRVATRWSRRYQCQGGYHDSGHRLRLRQRDRLLRPPPYHRAPGRALRPVAGGTVRAHLRRASGTRLRPGPVDE